ncbi:MAG: hypothetical protein JST59_11170 [Actinobacteria bacterium]|nr:hypothetical protein [Actinomycetota bacterium]
MKKDLKRGSRNPRKIELGGGDGPLEAVAYRSIRSFAATGSAILRIGVEVDAETGFDSYGRERKQAGSPAEELSKLTTWRKEG